MTEKQIASFWSKVRKTDGCWEWAAARNRGYGMFAWKTNGKIVCRGAHRISYALVMGEPPPELLIRHLCNNRACVRPDHLALGTHADNNADMVRAGRCGNRYARGLGAQP